MKFKNFQLEKSAYRFQDAREIHAELEQIEASLPVIQSGGLVNLLVLHASKSQNSQKYGWFLKLYFIKPESVNTEEVKINLSATITKTTENDSDQDEPVSTEDVPEIMKNRLIYRSRACSLRRKIQNLVTARDFDGLLALHKLIYDLDAEMPEDDLEPAQLGCS